MGEDKVHISFDEEFKIHVLGVDQFKHSQELDQECRGFVNKIQEFNVAVHSIVEVLDTYAQRIEREKLRAIGQRNKVDGETEWRSRKKMALQALIREKMAELDRHNLQFQSLQRVESEQMALIEKLSNSETLTADHAGHK